MCNVHFKYIPSHFPIHKYKKSITVAIDTATRATIAITDDVSWSEKKLSEIKSGFREKLHCRKKTYGWNPLFQNLYTSIEDGLEN